MTEIDLSGVFGWDITPSLIKEKLANAKSGDIQVNISSVGGEVFDGIDIFNQFREHKRKNPDIQMIARMSGVVASMAAYIAMAPFFDMVIVEDNAAFMIHNSWTFAIGDKNELRKAADMLDGLDQPMVKLVAKKTGESEKKAQALLDEESWFFQKEISQKLFGKYTQNIAASLKPQEENENIKKEQKQENNMALDQKEKEEIQTSAREAAHERVSSIMALKEKYKEQLKEKPEVLALITDIIDKAIVDPKAEKPEVLADIVTALSSGNVQAALESPGDTPQGSADTASGEPGAQPEEKSESF
jgi:ATP-dependent protease ClpP protease subunit